MTADVWCDWCFLKQSIDQSNNLLLSYFLTFILLHH